LAGSRGCKRDGNNVAQGYQLLHWADSDFNYWAVSDVNINDLQAFKQQFEAQTSRH
jgi:anti-sigma factor RsiW